MTEATETAQGISDRLGGKKQGKGYQACCPAHDDKHASLHIEDGESGKILLHCFAGCTFDAVKKALSLNGQTADGEKVFTKSKSAQPAVKPQIVAIYPYRDTSGKTIFEAVRYQPKDFKQRRPDGKGGHVWNLQGVPKLPYKLPEVLAGIKALKTVYIVEGEKDAETLHKNGEIATCNACGAGKWTAEHSGYLKGADVVIVPDNDESGRRHALTVAESLKGHAKSISFSAVPAKHQDVSDWCHAAGFQAVIVGLIDGITDRKPVLQAAPESAPTNPSATLFTLTRTRDVLTRPKPIYLYPGEIPNNSLITLSGASGNGKTFVALDYALTIAQTHKVIYVAAERPYAALMRACTSLDHHKWHDDNLRWIERAPSLTNETDVPALTAVIKDFGAALVVIDTFSRCADGINEDSNSEVKRVMQTLDDLRRDTGATVMVVHHTGWGGGRERGASAIRDYAEVAILVERADDRITISCNKMSNADEFEPRSMKLITVGDQAVVIPAARVVQTIADNLTPTQRSVLEALALPTFDQGARVAELSKLVPEIKAKDMYRVLAKLIDLGFARKDGRFDPYIITTEGSRKVSQSKKPHGDKVSQVSQ